MSPRTTDIDELRRAYIHKCNENTQLKQRITALEGQLEQRGEHAHNLETRIKSMEGNMQSMEDNLHLERKTHCAKMTNLVETLEWTQSMSAKIEELGQNDPNQNVLGQDVNHNLALEQMDIKDLEVEKLKNQREILEADINNKNDIEHQLREENQRLKDKDNRWYKKLQIEMEQNAEDMKSLNDQIFQLQEEN